MMKIKKSALAAVVLASIALVGFVGCQKEVAMEKPTLNIKNGALDIDPATIKTIDITFPEEMDTNYSDFLWWGNIDADMLNYGWANAYTYRFVVDLRYNTEYKLVLNDYETIGQNVNGIDHPYSDEYFFRTKGGKKIKRFLVQFTTKESPTKHPNTYEMSIENYNAQLVDNQYDEPGKETQQLLLGIKSLLNHDMVKAGDTVKIKYKIKSASDLKNVRTNLIDTHSSVKNWLKLNSDDTNDLILADNLPAGEIKEGVLEFKIATDQVACFALQIYADYSDNPSDLIIQFLE